MASMSFYSLPDWTNTYFGLGLFVGSGITLYYLIFEGLFHATPIKFLTGTRVVNVKTAKSPGFGKIIIRSLSRRIPFEAFSFVFGKKGWHDSISETAVVHEHQDGHVNFKNWY